MSDKGTHYTPGVISVLKAFVQIGVAALLLPLSGCGKSVIPKIDDLISKSSVIYLAEKRGEEYRVVKLLKQTSEAPITLSEGQVVVPNYQVLGHKPASEPHRIVVFVQSVTMVPGKQLNAGQTEAPLLANDELFYYGIDLQRLLQLIDRPSKTGQAAEIDVPRTNASDARPEPK